MTVGEFLDALRVALAAALACAVGGALADAGIAKFLAARRARGAGGRK